MRARLRVLVVDDSPTIREFLADWIAGQPDMYVVATAGDGEEAVRKARETRPDVVTMDVNMPQMDGLRATRIIMHECPVPIVVVSGVPGDRETATFRALEAGALAFVRRPPGPQDPMHAAGVAELVQTVRLMAEVRVVRRRATPEAGPGVPFVPPTLVAARPHVIRVVVIGASTGGPVAIRELLAALPTDFSAPILLVQHMPAGFVDGFVRWLGETTGHIVEVAADGARLAPGHVYVAPDGCHLGLDASRRAALSDAAPEHGSRPSVSCLFRAARETIRGEAAAILLSGMGKDGAQELLRLKEAGAVTFAQSRDSAAVFGMPGEAVRLEAASFVLPPAQIGAALAALVQRKSPRPRPV